MPPRQLLSASSKSRKKEPDSKDSIPAEKIMEHAEDWFLDCEIRQLSPKTIENRRVFTSKLSWYLEENKHEECGVKELKRFFHYLTTDVSGRWGNRQIRTKAKASTVHTYHNHLRAFFSWLVQTGELDESPIESVPVPVNREDQITPFTQQQVKSLLDATVKSGNRWRDKAILHFLLDTGARASEACGLRLSDVDMKNRRCTVIGKGNKKRNLYFSDVTHQALMSYLRGRGDEKDVLFLSEKGSHLNPNGLLQLFNRLGKAARIEAVRCSPHTCRHYFAIEFLRGGGNIFTLQRMLGHTSLAMMNRYVALAQADIEEQHKKNSPVTRLLKK